MTREFGDTDQTVEHWVTCTCGWRLPRQMVESLVQMRAQAGETVDTDDVAREKADRHEAVCPENGTTTISEDLK